VCTVKLVLFEITLFEENVARRLRKRTTVVARFHRGSSHKAGLEGIGATFGDECSPLGGCRGLFEPFGGIGSVTEGSLHGAVQFGLRDV
jgi:hypothetical protein